MTCCDTCPYSPTCEEMADFLDQIAVPADIPSRDDNDPPRRTP